MKKTPAAAQARGSSDGAPRRWDGAGVIVTGAGSGLGAAVCRVFAEAGARILLVGRNESRLRETRDALPTECAAAAGDVCDSAFCADSAARAGELFGRVDALVNNAGVIHRASVLETTDADWERVMRINADGVFRMTRAAIPFLRESRGAVVSVASTAGLVGCAGLSAYCASKGAVVQFTRAAALELAKDGVSVNAACPGAIDSPMLFAAHADGADAEAVRARNAADIPQGRIARAEEVARAVLFLATERHVTGAALSVDGAYVAR